MSWCETYSSLSYLRLQNICRTVSWKHNDMEIQEIQTQTGSTWGGNNFLLGCTDWCRAFATDLAWQTANSDSGMARKWPMPSFPAGIFPMGCIFSWSKQTGAMTSLFNTLRCWVWGIFFFFDQIRAGKWFCAYGFGAEGLSQEQAECMSWKWCHTTQNSALYLHK